MENPQLKCISCGYSEAAILGRRVTQDGVPMDTLNEYHVATLTMPESFIGPRRFVEHKCDSCMMHERGVAGSHVRCVGCGLAETLAQLTDPEDSFYVGNSSWPPTHWCQKCPKPLEIVMEELDNEYDEEVDMMECEYCGRIWDGNAQCPCFEQLSGWSTSEEENEPEEEDEPEEQEETNQNKENLKKIMDKIWENQEKFKEWDMKEIMDLLKEVYDCQ